MKMKTGLALVALLMASTGWGQTTFNKYGPAAGLQVNTGATYQNTTGGIADVQPVLSQSPGLVLGGATGGAKGVGSINATALFINGAAVGTSSGAVSSVGLTAPTCFGVTGSPVTAAGSLGLTLTGSVSQFLHADGSCAVLLLSDIPTGYLYSNISGAPTAANPSVLVGLTAKNGTATTFMRSDAAPALDLTISPTMTGAWTFTQTVLGSATAYEGFVAGPSVAGAGGVRFHATESISAHAHYAFVDDSTIAFTGSGTIGHASYDANPTFTGATVNFDHHHDYQASPHFGFTGGTATEVTSFQTQPFISSGTITSMYLFAGFNPVQTGGTIGTLYGLYLPALTDGGTNWAVFTGGSTPSSFGGVVNAGGISSSGQVVSSNSGSGSAAALYANAVTPAFAWNATSQATDTKLWDLVVSGATLVGRTINDAGTTAKTWLNVTRSANVISDITLGNATDNPTLTVIGSGRATFNGGIAALTSNDHQIQVNTASGQYTTVELQHAGTVKALLDWDNTNTRVDFGSFISGGKVVLYGGAGVAAATINTDTGLTVGSPTGGSQGAGTLNAAGLYVNGVAVSAGAIAKYAAAVVTIGASTCTVNLNTSNVPSCTFNSTGNVTVNFTSAFSTANCLANSTNGNPVLDASTAGSVTGSVNVLLNTSGTVATNGSFSLICVGS